MLTLILRYTFIIYCSIFSYYKILNQKSDKIYHKLIHIVYSLAAAILITLIPKCNSALSVLAFLIIFITINSHFTKTSFRITINAMLISFGISYSSLTISGLLLSLLVTPLYQYVTLHQEPFILIGSLLQYLLIYILFQTKRLKNGMPFLLHNSFISMGAFFAFAVIALYVIITYILSAAFSIHFTILVFITFLAIALLIWWRRKLTKSYVDKLRVDEVESLYLKVSDRDLEIDKLKAEVDHLSAIIHKDNKVIPAMDMAVRNYLQNAASMKPEDARQYGNELLIQLEKMTEDRKGILRDYHNAVLYRPQIGLCSVDAIILYMENRALERGIDYSYRFDKDLKDTMLRYISEEDANHLLADVIENAIIATANANTKKIKIHIGFIQDNLFMDISDSGIPFEPETYQNFGTTQHTTHKDTGGSGIGLMDIWKLKKKYKISLQIYEYPPKENGFTKKIRFFFDRKDHFLLQSYRAREVRSAVIRNDLYVFQYVDEENEVAMLNIDN